MKFDAHLQYGYAHVAVDLFFENSIPITFEVMVCISLALRAGAYHL